MSDNASVNARGELGKILPVDSVSSDGSLDCLWSSVVPIEAASQYDDRVLTHDWLAEDSVKLLHFITRPAFPRLKLILT